MSSPQPPPSPAMQPSQEAGSSKGPTLHNPRTQDVFDSIVKHRKSWKTLRGGEVVWPPELEAALIEGLENYQPDNSRETRLLGRFPMRNRYISEWILKKTGKRRTAKQVGSRLQQLRDTCGGKRLLNLLTPNRRPYRATSISRDSQAYGPPPLLYESESSSESSGSSPPPTPTEAHATLQSLLYRGVEPRTEELPNNIVFVNLLSADPSSSSSSSSSSTAVKSTAEQAAEERSWSDRGFDVVRASTQAPRRLRDIDSTVALRSRHPIVATAHFTVYSDDGVVHSESVPLMPAEHTTLHTLDDGALVYTAQISPEFWESTLLQCADPSRYVIVQRVVDDSPTSSSAQPIFSAMYRFCYAAVPAQPHVYDPSSNAVVAAAALMHDDISSVGGPSPELMSQLIPLDADYADLSGVAYSKHSHYDFDMVSGYHTAHHTHHHDATTTGGYGSTASASESVAGSVYHSPIDAHKQMPFGHHVLSASEEHHLLGSPGGYHPSGHVGSYVM